MEIMKDNKGNLYGLVNGVLIPIKAGVQQEKKTGKKQVKETQQEKIQEKKTISPQEIEGILKILTPSETVGIFGNVNKKLPYTIDTTEFWNRYELTAGNKHSISKRLKRENIIPKQMENEHLGKRAKTEIWINAKKELENSIKEWANRTNCYPKQRENATKWLQIEIAKVGELIQK